MPQVNKIGLKDFFSGSLRKIGGGWFWKGVVEGCNGGLASYMCGILFFTVVRNFYIILLSLKSNS